MTSIEVLKDEGKDGGLMETVESSFDRLNEDKPSSEVFPTVSKASHDDRPLSVESALPVFDENASPSSSKISTLISLSSFLNAVDEKYRELLAQEEIFSVVESEPAGEEEEEKSAKPSIPSSSTDICGRVAGNFRELLFLYYLGQICFLRSHLHAGGPGFDFGRGRSFFDSRGVLSPQPCEDN
ncbi:uncharacterized protein LOC113470461 [Diaphorina citri]|uniref:Uncharacterized protein LOC113470461 n=1 Tax=Diaphorina citri TaxID=121845 RepID=A0A3Q0J8B0_DIACI|nr:uncharacterized protein LOC113470461 [Diaphorina citri]